jgi:DNA-binding transcriptional regulator YiaG
MTISGTKIAQKRNKLKLSQAEFADLVGVSQSIISDWESGKLGSQQIH